MVLEHLSFEPIDVVQGEQVAIVEDPFELVFGATSPTSRPYPSPHESCRAAREALFDGDLSPFCESLPPCPADGRPGSVLEDIPYGDDPRQIFDIYLPADSGNEEMPAFVWIHGGAFRAGSHDEVPGRVLALRQRGVVVISIEYRFSDTPWPTTVSDVRSALRHIDRIAPDHHIDRDRIAVGGSSAGGHLSAIAALAPEVAALDLGDPDGEYRIAFAADFFGPTDLLTLDEDADAVGCPPDSLCHDCPNSPEAALVDCEGRLSTYPDTALEASPLTYVDAGDPPFYIYHGDGDCTVPYPQSQRLHEALLAVGVESSFILVEGTGHGLRGVGTPEVWDSFYGAVDEHLLQCVRE